MGTPGPPPETTLEDALRLFEDRPCTPLTATEVAEELDCARRTAHRKLVELSERGELETKKVGAHSRVWWRPTDEDDTALGQFAEFVRAVEDYAIFTLEPDGTVASWNQGAERIKGYEEREILGEHFSAFYTDEDVEQCVPERNLEAAAQRGRVEDEGWRVREDGSEFWAYVVITAVRDDEGKLQGFTKVTRDLTERKQAEDALEREREFLDTILEAVPMSVLAARRDGVIERTNERARDRFGVDESDDLTPGAWDVFDEDGNPVPVEDRPYWRAFETGEQILGWEGQFDLPDGRTWLSINVVPLGDKGSPERVLVVAEDVTGRKRHEHELERHRDELRAELDDVYERVTDAVYALDADWRFTHVNERAEELIQCSEAEVLGESFWEEFPEAADGGVRERYQEAMETQEPVNFERYLDALDVWVEINAYPSETGLSVYFRDITERVERERELERYRTIVETVQDGVYTVDADGRFTMVNEAYAEMTGYARTDLLGEHVSSVVDEETIETARDLERELASGERKTVKFEADVLRADGGTVRAEATFSLLAGEDGDCERVAVVRDVTERVERERQLGRYKTAVETASDVVVTIDEESTIRSANPAVETVFGYDPEEVVGEPLTTLMPDRLARAHREGLQRYLRDGEKHLDWEYLEFPGRHRDGHELPLAISFGEYEHDGDRFFTGIVRDNTERKERERELRRYETLIEEATDVNAIVDQEGALEYVTPSAEYVLGYTPEKLVGENAFDYIHPDDREEVGTKLATVVAEEEERPTTEFRFRHADGSWVWLEAHGRNLQGDPMIDGIVAYTHDVTDRKVYERELESRARQQDVVSELGQYALENPDLDDLLIEAVRRVSETLDTDYCKVLDLDPDAGELWLRQGVGWRDGIVGEATIDAADNSQAGYTLLSEDPVVVDDLGTEARFSGPELLTSHDVTSGISTIIGSPDRPWGIFGTHDTASRDFSAQDVDFVQAVANILATAIDRRQYERELEKYETIANTVDDGIYALDSDSRFVMVNDGFVEMTGYSREELIGEHASKIASIRAVAYGERVSRDLASAGRQVSAAREEFRTADGEEIPVENRIAHLPIDGGAYGRVGVARDIADRLERQRELEETVEALERSNEKLERFAYVTSHDLQEPLRMISNYLQLVESRYGDELDEDGREFIEFAVDGAERLRDMIDDLLTYSRVDTEAEPFEPTDGNDVVDRALANLGMQIEENDAEIAVSDLPTVVADENQLEQVFQNLVSNAIKYRGEEPPEIEIDAERTGEEWTFRVADNGIGMDPEDADRIFAVFQRLHTHEEYPGTGIGLALCKKIVERHGGDIWVESEPGEGSTFYFTIPTAENIHDRSNRAPIRGGRE